MVAVRVEGVSKRFRRQTIQPSTTLKTAVINFFQGRKRDESVPTFEVLSDITFSVPQGQTLGVIGRNGSGKSTLLKLLAGIYRPDSGKISVHGKLGALLELGAGFHPEFSGRENILINGIVLGLSKRAVRDRMDDIIHFAELEAFIDEPVKTYSLGMYMRLGFSVAVHADPDILLIDEILAVGDEGFYQKCFDKLAAFHRRGKTIILVSHELSTVSRWCDVVVWLEDGKVQAQGLPQRVIDRYRQHVAAQEGEVAVAEHSRVEEQVQQAEASESSNRWGSREIEILSVKMLQPSGQERYMYQPGEPARIVIHYRVHHPVPDVAFGIALLRGDGVLCYGTNTAIEGISLPPLGDEGNVEVFLERLDLTAGSYYLDAAVHAVDGYPYDYHHGLYSFAVKSALQDVGVYRIPHSWVIKPLVPVS
ncbi:MAG: ABC transporter ATP-binding protein [Candidatus Tectomicrobia bacterium]|nr:ABC transporter ATP-binding protein [Candidatus Tectomicrobia bacterium]